MLQEAFQHILSSQFPFLKDKKLLLAVSGGLDSMVLLDLFKQENFNIGIAHCNFQLRGNESDGDAIFVKAVSQKERLPYFEKRFDTSAFAKAQHISTQMAARELRYSWFDSLLNDEGYDYVLTAHHLNDRLETFLINLSRGSGIDGLVSIPKVNDTIVRPLLTFSRKDIEAYASTQKLEWREDSSNASDKYVRNHLRHHAIPAIEEIAPQFLETFRSSQEHLQQSQGLLKVYTSQLRQEMTYPINSIQGPSGICIAIEKVKGHTSPYSVLYALLKDYGFTAWEDVYDLLDAQPGKQIFSNTHRLLKDRDTLQLFKNEKQDDQVVYIDQDQSKAQGDGWVLFFDEADVILPKDATEIVVDAQKLSYPLLIRSWREGDYFYPLGLGGKKKLSKYFKDEKLSLVTKENIKLLCSGENIIWIMGHRADDRYKVTPATTKTTKIKLSYDS